MIDAAKTLAAHPTTSLHSFKKIYNKTATFAIEQAFKENKKYKVNLSEEKIKEKVLSLSQEHKTFHLKMIKNNIFYSSVLIDHTTNHKKNYLAILGCTVDRKFNVLNYPLAICEQKCDICVVSPGYHGCTKARIERRYQMEVNEEILGRRPEFCERNEKIIEK